ncbi:MAG TPA: UMP kinase [Nitrososphaeraceae archaeon]|jgi:uridylate kinase|nr:UMP kinase [Nitrososphaeraceae archaeon]
MDYNNNNYNSRKKRIVIKLSGSIFNQDTNHDSIKDYAQMLIDISNKVQLIVITGGGKIARHYIDLARSLGSDEANLDIIGIEVSRLNAKLLIAALGDQAYSQVPKNLEEVAIAVASGKIVIAGGLHPGQSTNATSALIAETSKASGFVNSTDVDGIYDSDPNVNPNARLFKEITVNECMEILRAERTMAGTYDLMDIIALKVIERSKIPTRVIRSDVGNIRDAIDGKDIGTKIITIK